MAATDFFFFTEEGYPTVDWAGFEGDYGGSSTIKRQPLWTNTSTNNV